MKYSILLLSSILCISLSAGGKSSKKKIHEPLPGFFSETGCSTGSRYLASTALASSVPEKMAPTLTPETVRNCQQPEMTILSPLQGRKALILTVLQCYGYSMRAEDIVWETIDNIRVNRAAIDRNALTEALRTISLQRNLSNFADKYRFIEELRQFLITEGADIFVDDNAILKNFFARGNWEGVRDICVVYAKVAADYELMQIHRGLFYDALLFCSQQSEPSPDNKDIFHKLVKILIQNCDVYQDDHRILRNFLDRNNWLGLQLLVLYAYETNIDQDIPLQFLLSALSTISQISAASKTSLGFLVMQTHQKIRDLHYQNDQFLLNCIANKYFGRVALHILEDAKRNRTPYGLSVFNRCTLSGDKKIKEYIENEIQTLRKNIAPEHLWVEVEYQTYQLVPEPFVGLEFMQEIYRRCADKTPLMLDDIIVEILNLRNELYGDQIVFQPSPLSETMVISEQEWQQSLEAEKKREQPRGSKHSGW